MTATAIAQAREAIASLHGYGIGHCNGHGHGHGHGHGQKRGGGEAGGDPAIGGLRWGWAGGGHTHGHGDANRQVPLWNSDVTFIVKTFERPCCVARLLKSIRNYFPHVLVRVCDDSRETLFDDGAEPSPGIFWHTLDYDLGHTLGAGRNHLLELTSTRYFFLLDDDHQITPKTNIERMHAFLERTGFDIVAGAQGTSEYGAAIFQRFGPYVLQRFGKHHGIVEPGVVRCDRTSNTFLGRVESVKRVRWNPHVYAGEHADFFFRATHAGLRIAQMGGVCVEHDRSCEPAKGAWSWLPSFLLPHRDGDYRAKRLGDHDKTWFPGLRAKRLYRKHVLDPHGIRDIIDIELARDQRQLMREIGRIAE